MRTENNTKIKMNNAIMCSYNTMQMQMSMAVLSAQKITGD